MTALLHCYDNLTLVQIKVLKVPRLLNIPFIQILAVSQAMEEHVVVMEILWVPNSSLTHETWLVSRL